MLSFVLTIGQCAFVGLYGSSLACALARENDRYGFGRAFLGLKIVPHLYAPVDIRPKTT